MTCVEFKEVVHAYALGALEAEEREACAEHLGHGGGDAASHEGCREALREAEAVVMLPGLAQTPVRPAAGVWEGIAAVVGAGAGSGTGIGIGIGDGSGSGSGIGIGRRVRVWAPWVIAVAAVLALVLWPRGKTDEVARLLVTPGTRVVRLAGETGEVVVVVAEGRGLVLASALTAPAGKDYELWIIRGEQKIAAGLIRGSSWRTWVDLAGVDALAVTLEPKGGGAQPVGPIVLVSKI